MKISASDILPQIAAKGLGGSQPSSGTDRSTFAQVLNQLNNAQHQADGLVRKSLAGQADLHEVMIAMEKAGLGLKVLVQARNKMIQAYEELSRMNM
jgi:flagellar hook-basal body complex protein FliE